MVLLSFIAVSFPSRDDADDFVALPITMADHENSHRNTQPNEHKSLLIGGVLGGTAAYILQWWINTISYPINIGGRPFHSWPSFIIVTFEMTILFSGLSAVFGMLALNGLPMPYHPVFNVPQFNAASKDRFFSVIFSSDKKYDPVVTRQFLDGLNPVSVAEVPS